MKTIFLPKENNFFPIGTNVLSYFEGRGDYGVLAASDEDKHLILMIVNGKRFWTHENNVSLSFKNFLVI